MYHRPLDTLLVTWGVALVLQQLARDVFGTAGVDVPAPAWLSGPVEVLGFAFPQVAAVHPGAGDRGVRRAGRRAASSPRSAAASGPPCRTGRSPRAPGISTRATDRLTFFIGSGLAGVAGVALTLMGSISPNLGTGYIIDAFLVVVVGGVGQIKGAVIAAFVLGVVQAWIEYSTTASHRQGDRVRPDRRVPAGPAAGHLHQLRDEEPRMSTLLRSRWAVLGGFAIAAVLLFVVAPARAVALPARPARQVPAASPWSRSASGWPGAAAAC